MSYYHLALSFVWSFLISVFAIPSIVFVAHIKNLLDEPNKRTMHKSLTPRLGGLAIFAGFFSSLTIFGELDFGVQQLLAGAIIIFFIGLKDDIVSVSAFKKFFVQILAAGIVMFMGGIRITDFHGVMGLHVVSDQLSYAFTFFVIIGITNAINLIDGVDGLAGTIIAIICISFGFFFYFNQDLYSFAYAFVAASLLGSIIGFLRYNLQNAIIFMGDTGSLVCGFIISVMAIQFIEMKGTETSPCVAIAILFIPILDTLRVFFLRIINGISPFSPDKNHIHHRLIALGLSPFLTVASLAALNVIAIVLAIFSVNAGYDNMKVILLLVTYALLFSIILELIYKRKLALKATVK